MNARFVIILFFLVLPFQKIVGQLVADAGEDFNYCGGSDSTQLGGFPAASGGVEPYTYFWEYNYKRIYNDRIPEITLALTISDFLNDSVAANPYLDCCPYPNATVTFILTVTDANSNIARDSVDVTMSAIGFVTAVFYRPTIDPGDSVILRPANIINGIPPISYHWTPETGISDPYTRNPYASPKTTTWYYCTAIDSIGCTVEDEMEVVVRGTGVFAPLNADYKPIVYPNPIEPGSVIRFSNPEEEKLSIEVINETGQVVPNDSFQSGTYYIGQKIHQDGLFLYVIKKGSAAMASGRFIKM